MGKKNFPDLYRCIKNEFGEISCKISYYSDGFDENKNYAGMIVYAVDGKFQWMNNSGKASGHRGRSFYVVIQCTDKWSPEAFQRAGKGMVHDHVIKDVLGINYVDTLNESDKRRVCCGGFAYHEKRLKISSWWLNSYDQVGCETDKEKNLSEPERILVEYCFEQYKNNGVNKVFKIPSHIERQILGENYSTPRVLLSAPGYYPPPPPISFLESPNTRRVSATSTSTELEETPRLARPIPFQATSQQIQPAINNQEIELANLEENQVTQAQVEDVSNVRGGYCCRMM